jgi:hypothetical protein
VSYLVIRPVWGLFGRRGNGWVRREILRLLLLGYLDSNQEQMNQNHPCCQLHHTPMALSEDRAEK